MELELERTIFIISNTWKRRGSLNLRIDRRVDSSKRACRDFPSLARVCKLSARTNTRETVSSLYQTFESFIKRMENEICHGSLIWKDKIVMFQKMAWFGKLFEVHAGEFSRFSNY